MRFDLFFIGAKCSSLAASSKTGGAGGSSSRTAISSYALFLVSEVTINNQYEWNIRERTNENK